MYYMCCLYMTAEGDAYSPHGLAGLGTQPVKALAILLQSPSCSHAYRPVELCWHKFHLPSQPQLSGHIYIHTAHTLLAMDSSA